MNLLAQPREEKIEVPVCAAVLHHGSRAGRKRGTLEPLFPHLHVPHRPAKLARDEAWLLALDYAEEVHRFDQSPRAVLRLDGKVSRSLGGRCGGGEPRLRHDSQGIKVDELLLKWPRLLAARGEQREVEPEVARARDLAQAYRYLDYFGEVYGEPEDREGFDGIGEQFSPVPLVRRLAEEAIELGGNPAQLPVHTTYMRQGIAEARQGAGALR